MDKIVAVTRAVLLAMKAGETETVLALSAHLEDLMDDSVAECSKNGKPPRKMSWNFAMASLAAAVTVLKEDGLKVEDAITRVATRCGINRKELRRFRDYTSRRHASKVARSAYGRRLVTYRAMPRDKMMRYLDTHAKKIRSICT
jgi:hypothetical protein